MKTSEDSATITPHHPSSISCCLQLVLKTRWLASQAGFSIVFGVSRKWAELVDGCNSGQANTNAADISLRNETNARGEDVPRSNPDLPHRTAGSAGRPQKLARQRKIYRMLIRFLLEHPTLSCCCRLLLSARSAELRKALLSVGIFLRVGFQSMSNHFLLSGGPDRCRSAPMIAIRATMKQ